MTHIPRTRLTALILTAVATAVAVTVAMPAEAAAPTYAPGDVVTVNGISVTAPLTTGSVALSVDRVDGTSQTLLVSTDANGRVTVGDGSAAAAPTGALAPNKCDDSAFTVINGATWPSKYKWNYRTSTTPNELTVAAATQALKQSVNNVTNASNGCGLTDQVSLKNKYKGSTNQASDVSSAPACAANPQPLNVTEFGPISGGGILAATCTYSTGSGGTITDADVRINSGQFEWWTGGSCSGAYGLRAVQTHEYGHAVGMGHVDEPNHGNLTMSTNINSSCSDFEASLGKGDVLGLNSLY